MLRTVAAFDRIGEENAFAVLARATQLAAQGRDIVNLGIGQPDFRTPAHIVEAAVKALRDGHHGYTPPPGGCGAAPRGGGGEGAARRPSRLSPRGRFFAAARGGRSRSLPALRGERVAQRQNTDRG